MKRKATLVVLAAAKVDVRKAYSGWTVKKKTHLSDDVDKLKHEDEVDIKVAGLVPAMLTCLFGISMYACGRGKVGC